MKKPQKKSPKIVIFAVVGVVAINFFIYFFTLMPIYSILGDSTISNEQAQQKLDKAAAASRVFGVISYVILAILAVYFIKGMISYIKNRKK